MEMVKAASALAKGKKFNEAIETLIEFYQQGDFTDADLIKVIPYFQKAGRYYELGEFCKLVIIPGLNKVNYETFSHKCKEIQEAFMSLKLHKMYSKLELCAKREEVPLDVLKYKELSEDYYQNYVTLLKEGEEVEERKEYQEYLKLFGNDTSCWPDIIQRSFSKYIQ